MRVDLQTSPVERSDDFQEVAFHIPKEETAKVAELVIKRLYESEIRFVVELVANAYDAAPGASPTIHWPTKDEPWFEVEDIGPGMSAEFMATKYCQIFSSTKDQDDSKIGGWGMGRLSALAISESYGIISDDGVTRRVYSVFKGEMGMPTLALLVTEASKGRGTKVTVPVPDNKVSLVRQEGSKLLPFFSPAPSSNMMITPVKIAYEHPTGEWKIREREGPIKGNYVVMGGYPYPIDHGSLPYNGPGRNLFGNYDRFLLELPINALDVTSNRERLRYTEKTNALLDKIAAKLKNEFHESLEAMVTSKPTYWEAVAEFGRLMVELPMDLKRSAKDKLLYDDNGEIRIVNDMIDLRPDDVSAMVPYGTGVKFFINAGNGRRRSNRNDKPTRPKWDITSCDHVWPFDNGQKTYVVLIDAPIKAVLPTISYNLGVGARVYAVWPKENETMADQLVRLGNPPETVLMKISDMPEPPKEIRQRQSGPKVKVKNRDWSRSSWDDEFSWDVKTGGTYVDFCDGAVEQGNLVSLAQGNQWLRPTELVGIPRSSFKTRTGYQKLEDFMRPIVKSVYTKRNLQTMANLKAYGKVRDDWELKRLLKHANNLTDLRPIKKLADLWTDNPMLRQFLYDLSSINQRLDMNIELPAPTVDPQVIIKAMKDKRPVLFEVLSNIDNPSKELLACIL